MNNIQQSVTCVAERTWAWDNREKILYLSASEINSSLFCNIIHKLTHFLPRRILIYIKDDWYEVCKEYLDILKSCSQKVKEEKIELYKVLSEKDDLNFEDIRNQLSINPFYGSLYLKSILSLKLSNELLTRCNFKGEKDIFTRRLSGEHKYTMGHLVYLISSEKNLYEVLFISDDYFWINKELSTALRYTYSEKMLKSGKLKHIYEHRFKTGFKLLNILTLKKIEDPVKKSLAKHSVYSSIGLSKVFPLINDSNVQSFFLDSVGKRLYIDHAIFGRLNTNLRFYEKDFESFVTLVKRESNLNLDYANPSIKASIFFNEVPTRVSIDIHPLTWSRGAIDVRKHMVNVLPLCDLLTSNYFSPESAALLISAVLNRANISIIGEPNSGKTSLLNFLSYFMPPWWRIIHIEDALETLPPGISDQHRVVYVVEPFESREVRSTKTLEIIKVLHRTPSYLILGEIQTKSHIRAMFQAMAAGLRIMHTAHASDSNGFIKRLVKVYDIPELLVSELDLIVVLKKIEMKDAIKRFVSEIMVVDEDSSLKKFYSAVTALHDDLNALRLFEKLARLNCMEEEILYKMYGEIKRIINNNRYSENLVIKCLIQETYLKILKNRGSY
jgi:type IV secretory pathway ATPase VirB11/archaellum biosynthesis ATPase